MWICLRVGKPNEEVRTRGRGSMLILWSNREIQQESEITIAVNGRYRWPIKCMGAGDADRDIKSERECSERHNNGPQKR